MKKQDIIKCIDKLSSNAMFNLSLTSKELFHSNFWAWMLRKYPNIFAPVFGLENETEPFEVYREKSHFDLSVQTKNKIIIIENKLKSLPRKAQLEHYASSDSSLNKKLILISYLNPLFRSSLSGLELFGSDIEWDCHTYGALYRKMKNCFNSAKSSDFDGDDMFLIKDYIEFINFLVEFQNSIEFNLTDKIGDLWALIKDGEIQEKLSKINFCKTFERMFTAKLTQTVLDGFEFIYSIDEIRIDCGKDLKIFSDILFYIPGAWDKDISKQQDLCYLGVSLWEKDYRYYAGMHKSKCNITLPKQGRYDKENKISGYKYLIENYNWFFNRENQGSWNGYSYDNEMYLYKKIDISDFTVAELSEKVQFDLGLIYAYIEDFCK